MWAVWGTSRTTTAALSLLFCAALGALAVVVHGGDAAHDSGQVQQACQQLEAVLQRQPYHRDARLTLIQYYLENGQEPKAQQVMQSWKQLNPGDPALK